MFKRIRFYFLFLFFILSFKVLSALSAPGAPSTTTCAYITQKSWKKKTDRVLKRSIVKVGDDKKIICECPGYTYKDGACVYKVDIPLAKKGDSVWSCPPGWAAYEGLDKVFECVPRRAHYSCVLKGVAMIGGRCDSVDLKLYPHEVARREIDMKNCVIEDETPHVNGILDPNLSAKKELKDKCKEELAPCLKGPYTSENNAALKFKDIDNRACNKESKRNFCLQNYQCGNDQYVIMCDTSVLGEKAQVNECVFNEKNAELSDIYRACHVEQL